MLEIYIGAYMNLVFIYKEDSLEEEFLTHDSVEKIISDHKDMEVQIHE